MKLNLAISYPYMFYPKLTFHEFFYINQILIF